MCDYTLAAIVALLLVSVAAVASAVSPDAGRERFEQA